MQNTNLMRLRRRITRLGLIAMILLTLVLSSSMPLPGTRTTLWRAAGDLWFLRIGCSYHTPVILDDGTRACVRIGNRLN